MLKPALLAIALMAPLAAPAAVLYKLTDRVGNVTYADDVPRAFDGKVEKMDIDTRAKVVASDRLPSVMVSSSLVPGPDPAANDARIAAARANVDAARAALADARDNSRAEDWTYFGPNNPVGMRRAPKPGYQARLARLEADVRAAEEHLRVVIAAAS